MSSIKEEITRISTNISNAFDAITQFGVEIDDENKKSDNLQQSIQNIEEVVIQKNLTTTQTMQGSLEAPAFYATSDIRCKDIVKNIETNVEKYANLPEFLFKWNNNQDSDQHIGTSAQEVEKILPELVNENKEGFKSLDYATLGAVGMIECAREIINLKQQIADLKEQLNQK